MGLFSNKSSSNAIDAEDDAYDDAAASLSPYTEFAQQDFDSARNAIYQGFDYLLNRPHYAQGISQSLLGQTPSELLDQAYSGYSMSPATQQQMQIAESGVQNSMAASGMAGSGDNMLASAEVGSMIYNQGMDQYLNQLMDAFGVQMNALAGYQQPISGLTDAFSNMLGTEYGASTQLANDAMKRGQVQANTYNRQAMNQRSSNPLRTLGGMATAGVMF